jgi:hypothetical protein
MALADVVSSIRKLAIASSGTACATRRWLLKCPPAHSATHMRKKALCTK